MEPLPGESLPRGILMAGLQSALFGPDVHLRSLVEDSLRFLFELFFAPRAKHRGFWREAKLLASTVLMVRGLVVLRAARKKGRAQRILAMGDPFVERILFAEAPKMTEIRKLLDWQSSIISGTGGVAETAVYVHFSRDTVDVGKARSKGLGVSLGLLAVFLNTCWRQRW